MYNILYTYIYILLFWGLFIALPRGTLSLPEVKTHERKPVAHSTKAKTARLRRAGTSTVDGASSTKTREGPARNVRCARLLHITPALVAAALSYPHFSHLRSERSRVLVPSERSRGGLTPACNLHAVGNVTSSGLTSEGCFSDVIPFRGIFQRRKGTI